MMRSQPRSRTKSPSIAGVHRGQIANHPELDLSLPGGPPLRGGTQSSSKPSMIRPDVRQEQKSQPSFSKASRVNGPRGSPAESASQRDQVPPHKHAEVSADLNVKMTTKCLSSDNHLKVCQSCPQQHWRDSNSSLS
ncbi:hypothetical protein PCANC_16402 [Puccinia coronata f. sp. avenae]|uniref:Uncharacterized protein n=1 Tax=Puccinia coronata f. sp. avenae TaxID=200324 RepID=A0A2N5SYJ0_9BASI|nr:hypothetical protein PCASD_22804 [Puccinia coronata f. sp. avenae]PLW18284.1 hypothetical protein PCANC_16402 [Puccinia coronata f. sp. avenae]PLW47809.1 hypothetical protein PCASD_04306 [Puccinia coronata f. sp. avenae]